MKPLTTMHSHVFVVLLACAGILGLTTTSQAIPFDQSITKNDAQLGGSNDPSVPFPDQTISFSGLNPNPTSAATITFSVRGDFDQSSENVILSVDGFSFGTWLNNLADDTITGPANDAGNQYVSILTGTAVIPLVSFSGLVGDGNLDFLFDYSTNVNNGPSSLSLLDLAQVRVQYEAGTSTVPEPGTIFLFGSGLAGLAAWRYRKKPQKPKPQSIGFYAEQIKAGLCKESGFFVGSEHPLELFNKSLNLDACCLTFGMDALLILRPLFECNELGRFPILRPSHRLGQTGRQWLWLLSPKGKSLGCRAETRQHKNPVKHNTCIRDGRSADQLILIEEKPRWILDEPCRE